MLARISYVEVDDSDVSRRAVPLIHHTGKLSGVLVQAFDRWKAGEIEHVTVQAGASGFIAADEVDQIFDALRTVEARP